MIISLIAAASKNNVIGKDNDLPWSLPVDMKYFKNTTWGMPMIMGRKTYESNGYEALPGRLNIVITRQKNLKPNKGVIIVNTWNEALIAAKETDSKEVFVIGGGEIFKDVINKADRIYLTRVHALINGDVFFPEIDATIWKQVSNRDCFADEKHKYDYSFQIWEKR